MTKSLMPVIALLLLIGVGFVPAVADVRAESRENREPLLIIVSERTGLTNISSAMLRRVFEGYPTEYSWGKRLIALNQPSNAPLRVRFDRALLGRSPDEVGRFWVDQRIRGASEPPRAIPTPELAVRVVGSLLGAVTYVTPAQVAGPVRILSIDGKAPSDRGYPLAR